MKTWVNVAAFVLNGKSEPLKLFRSAKCFMFCAGGLELETNLTFLDYISFLLDIKCFQRSAKSQNRKKTLKEKIGVSYKESFN